jgi:hypothetical protein
MSEELEALHGAWWNTSDGLATYVSGIDKTPGWQKFANSYDNPKNRNHRITEVERVSGFLISPALVRLRALAEIAAGGESDFRFPEHLNLDGTTAGRLLAEDFLMLFSPKRHDRLQACVRMAAEESKKHNPYCKVHLSSVADIVFAFVSFVEREHRLPDKRELNIEAGRIKEQLAESDPRWNDGRWEDDEVSRIRKKAGLNGLPNARRI